MRQLLLTHTRRVRLNDSMGAITEAEQTVVELLVKARAPEDFETAASQLAKALEIADRFEIRVSSRGLTGGGAEGHDGRMDAARIGITALLVVGVLGVVAWSLQAGQLDSAASYVSPLTGLAGICLGWLFTNDRMPIRTSRTHVIRDNKTTEQQG